MNIRELMDSLERRAKLSDEGYNTEVKLNLHVVNFNSSGYYIKTEIAEVSNVWIGFEDGQVMIESVLSEEDVDKIKDLKDSYLGIKQ